MFPTSSPKTLSKIAEIGKEIGNVKKTKNHTSQVVCAPMIRAYREQTAYGTISPNMVMIAVDTSSPVNPEVKSPMRIDNPEFTVTLPSKMVQRSKLPLLLSGKIAKAYLASVSSSMLLKGPFVRSSKFFTSNPRRPKFKPEKQPESIARPTMRMNFQAGTGPASSSGVRQ